jgi:hypothetical protein
VYQAARRRPGTRPRGQPRRAPANLGVRSRICEPHPDS